MGGCGSSTVYSTTTIQPAKTFGPGLTVPTYPVASASITTESLTVSTRAQTSSTVSERAHGHDPSASVRSAKAHHAGGASKASGKTSAHSKSTATASGAGRSGSAGTHKKTAAGARKTSAHGSSKPPVSHKKSTSPKPPASHPSSGAKQKHAGDPTATPTQTITVTSPTPPSRVQTVTVAQTITVVHTVAPTVPSGAHVPARQVAHASAFRTSNGNVGCALNGVSVRCDIGVRVWATPPEPSSCQFAWGQGLVVGPSGDAHFVCAADSVLDPNGYVVPNGIDDVVGSVTCQVRSFGVTCFDGEGRGFFISRTGYATF